LLAAIRDHDDLRTALWRGFSGPSIQLFGNEESEDGGSITATAVLVLAAGAALFTSLIAVEDDTPELRAKILELLMPVARLERERP
jgi:hypothetical protein